MSYSVAILFKAQSYCHDALEPFNIVVFLLFYLINIWFMFYAITIFSSWVRKGFYETERLKNWKLKNPLWILTNMAECRSNNPFLLFSSSQLSLTWTNSECFNAWCSQKFIHTKTNLKAAGLFKYVWPFSGHQVPKG